MSDTQIDPVFEEFKRCFKVFQTQFFTIIQTLSYSNFGIDLTKLENPVKATWKIDLKIGVDKEGNKSPFFLDKKKYWEVSGLDHIDGISNLLDFGMECLLESLVIQWMRLNKQRLPMGWSGDSLFGHFSLDPEIPGESDQDLSSIVDVRYGNESKIVAILLVKNCELSIEKVVQSICRTSDYQLVLDDSSSDSTLEVLRSISQYYPGLIIRDKILGMSSSQDYIQPLINTKTTIWRVDSDEFWSPSHIPIIKRILNSEEWENCVTLHLTNARFDAIKVEGEKAFGKARTATPFHNFGNIISWDQPNERLHGENKIIKDDAKEVLEIKNSGILMAHFPTLTLSNTVNNSDSANLIRWKESKYNVKDEEIEEIDLIDFDCVKEITSAIKQHYNLLNKKEKQNE